MSFGKLARRTFATLLAASVITSGAMLGATGAHAESGSATPQLQAAVTELPNDKIVVEATGSGYETVAADSGQVNLGIVEKGGVLTDTTPVTVAVGSAGKFTSAPDTLVRPVAALDASKHYEVISWPSNADPAVENIFARADLSIDWQTLLPPQPEESTDPEAAPEEEPGEETASVEPNPESKAAKPAAKDAAAEDSVAEDSVATEDEPDDPAREADRPEGSRSAPGVLDAVAVAMSDQKQISVTTTAVPDEKIVLSVSGSGFGDVEALPGQSEPHAYLALIPKGSNIDGLEQGDMLGEVSASIRPDGTFTTANLSGAWEIEASLLDRDLEYEAISWPSRSNPTTSTLYTSVDVTIDWDALFPADAPRVRGTVTGASKTAGLTVQITTENIAFPEDSSVSGVTVAVAERGKRIKGNNDLAAHGYVSVGDIIEGRLDESLTVPKSLLDRSKQYEVLLFEQTNFAEKIASSGLTVSTARWNAVFGAPPPATVKVTKVAVVKTGLRVEVTATKLRDSKLYVGVLERGKESDLSQDGGYMESGFLYQPPVKNGKGTFKFTLSKNDLDRKKKYEVLIWKSHSNPDSSTINGRADINITEKQWDALANTKPAKKADKTEKPVKKASRSGSAAAGSLTWGISSGFADYTTNKKRAGGKSGGKILTSGVGGGRGGYVFPQAIGGSWNKRTQTGSVNYSGVVTFTAHKGLMNESFANPVIRVTSATSGTISAGGRTFTLDLGSASKSTGDGGSVTWSNVPVGGSISGGGGGGGGSIAVDPLSFTVGVASKASYGSSSEGAPEKPQRFPAPTAPATTGITVLTDAEKLEPGGRIEMQSSGFEPGDEGILVVLYSDPIVLDEEAKADENGVVHWSGTLPDDIEPGDHVITLQGSINTGAEIELLDEKKKKKAAAATDDVSAADRIAVEEAAQAGIFSGRGGMSDWEWWASAGGLVLIAACTTLLAVRQRKLQGESALHHQQ